MSREIKFRIWDNNKNEWLGASDNDVLTYYGFHLVGEVMTVQAPPQWALDDHCVIEQYTGLKDKNGKEIYEGDILQIDDHILGDFVVVWHNFGWKIKRSVGYESLSVHKSEDCAVIGNIHENPELVGGKK